REQKSRLRFSICRRWLWPAGLEAPFFAALGGLKPQLSGLPPMKRKWRISLVQQFTTGTYRCTCSSTLSLHCFSHYCGNTAMNWNVTSSVRQRVCKRKLPNALELKARLCKYLIVNSSDSLMTCTTDWDSISPR